MKRQFFYKIEIEVDEPSKPKGDDSKSLADSLLRMLETRIKLISIKKDNVSLSVKSVKPSDPDESEARIEHRKKTRMLLEILTKPEAEAKHERNPNYLLRVKTRLRNKNVSEIPEPDPHSLLKVRQRLRNKSLCQ